MGIKRRDFFKQSALILSAAGSVRWAGRALATGEEMPAAEYSGPGQETWKSSVCRLCSGGCGIRVRLVDGQPVKIEGNSLSPVNRGGLCPTGHSGLQAAFHPERITRPLKRTGERGQGRWKQVSWDEALQEISSRLKPLINKGEGHRLAFLHHDLRGAMGSLAAYFMQSLGSPNLIDMSETRLDSLPFYYQHGKFARPAYDFLNSRIVVSFGSDFLGSEGPPAWMASIFSRLRQSANSGRVRFVQISSRFSSSAAQADQWLPVKPGTAGALALGVAYILIVERLYDADYLAAYTSGFEDWQDERGQQHIGFKTLVLRDYYPERVSSITGVSVDQIVRLARGLAENRPAVVIAGEELKEQSNGFYSQLAVHSLNALVGSLEKRGGVQSQPDDYPTSLPAIPDRKLPPRLDEYAGHPVLPGSRSISRFRENLLSGKPYPVEVLFLHRANPLFSLPQEAETHRALEKVPFIVSFAGIADETARLADLILPDHSYLEKWDLDYGVPYLPYLHVSLSQPVVAPRHNTRNSGEVLLNILQKLGRPLNYRDYPEFIRKEAHALFKAGYGVVPESEFDEFFYGYTQERGFHYGHPGDFEQFWESLLQGGEWIAFPNRPEAPHFATASGKFEFFSRSLQRYGVSGSETDEQCLPHFEPARFAGSEEKYPLFFIPFHTVTLFNGEGANRPMLLEMAGHQRGVRWDSWVELNPETAKEFGIADGERVWIESEQGKVRTRARLFAAALPGVLFMAIGLGHTDYGKLASGRGANPHKLVTANPGTLNGALARQATRVKIYKA